MTDPTPDALADRYQDALIAAAKIDEDAFLCDFGGITSVNLPNLDVVIPLGSSPAVFERHAYLRGLADAEAAVEALDDGRDLGWPRHSDRVLDAIRRLREPGADKEDK